MTHRKLFPAENSTYTTQTADCKFCDPGCPPVFCFPTVVINLPPPPPPPPPPPLPHHHHVSSYLIIFICLIIGFFLFIMFNVIKTKVREVNQATGNDGRSEQTPSDGSDGELADENRIDHPIWYISTAGLQQSVINSISVCKYRKGEGLVEGTECSVCLNEFQEDETLRLLPKCNHAFHVSCIDTWLKSHTNCPMCRARIVSSSVTSPLPTVDHNLANSTTVIANSQIGNSETDRESGENQERNGQARENRTGTEEGEVLLQAGAADRILIDIGGANSNENGVLQVLDDSGDGIQAVEEEENDSQPFRRSVSLDETMTLGLDDCGPVDQINDDANCQEPTWSKLKHV